MDYYHITTSFLLFNFHYFTITKLSLLLHFYIITTPLPLYCQSPLLHHSNHSITKVSLLNTISTLSLEPITASLQSQPSLHHHYTMVASLLQKSFSLLHCPLETIRIQETYRFLIIPSVFQVTTAKMQLQGNTTTYFGVATQHSGHAVPEHQRAPGWEWVDG